MSKLLLLLSMFFISFTSFGQTKKNDLIDILKKIREINEVQYEYVGYEGTESDNYKNYLALKERATVSQLVKLTDDSNSVVACYSSWALIEKSYNDLPSIFKKFLDSERYVSTFSGCNKLSGLLSSEIYHKYWNSIDSASCITDKFLFKMDSMILYNDKSNWLLLLRALENRIYPVSYNKQIEHWAFSKTNRHAIKYLKNLNDKTYDEQIKQAIIKYFQQTNFSGVGINVYLDTIKELLDYNDENLKGLIIDKLSKDRFWRVFDDVFVALLKQYGISETDIK